MKNPKKLLLALLVLLGAAAAFELAPAQATPANCAAVLCLPCPEGTVAAPKPGNCCRCVPAP